MRSRHSASISPFVLNPYGFIRLMLQTHRFEHMLQGADEIWMRGPGCSRLPIWRSVSGALIEMRPFSGMMSSAAVWPCANAEAATRITDKQHRRVRDGRFVRLPPAFVCSPFKSMFR